MQTLSTPPTSPDASPKRNPDTAASAAAPKTEEFATTIIRRKTRSVSVGDVSIGSSHPVVVQSMINEDTLDIDGSVAGIRRLHEAGCEIVRVTVPSMAHARALKAIKAQLAQTYQAVPLVADVHHNGMKIALEVAKHVDKVRINPGLYVFEKPSSDRTEYTPEEFASIGQKIQATLEPLVVSLRDQGKAMRIGVNHGSLAERMLFTYGDTPRRYGRIRLRIHPHLRIAQLPQPNHLAQSLPRPGHASRLPPHGKTHGSARHGLPPSPRRHRSRRRRIWSDQIHCRHRHPTRPRHWRHHSRLPHRSPEKEIPVCYSILQALGLRKTMVEYVACPSCGRTLFNLEDVLHKVRAATSHLTGLDIAVMGCIVNGPGEMADADYGYVGKQPGTIALYRGREEIKRVPETEGVAQLIDLIKSDGRWVEPDAETDLATQTNPEANLAPVKAEPIGV